MADTVYALLVRDLASRIDRERLDDGLAGRVTIRPDETEDAIDPFATGADRFPDRIPALSQTTPRVVIPRHATKEELAASWGRTPEHIAANQLFEGVSRAVPKQKPGQNPMPPRNP